YVRDNSVVRRGLTLYGVRWALTTGQLGNWIPLTWLSYMLDVQLFGISAGALHLVNVGLHVANTLLLFAVLLRMSGATWPSPAAGVPRPLLRAQARRAPTAPRSRAVPMRTLVWEKAPLLLLSAVASTVAVIAQERSGAITSAERLPVGVRVANAIVAYVRYLLMAIWPADLAVLYPYGRQIPAWQVLGAALILALVSAVVLR